MSGENKPDETIEAIKRMGTKVFEIISVVQPVTGESDQGKIAGIDWRELLGQYKGQKIRIVIEKLNIPPAEVKPKTDAIS